MFPVTCTIRRASVSAEVGLKVTGCRWSGRARRQTIILTAARAVAETARRLACSRIVVSCDGTTQSAYERYRRGADLATALRFMRDAKRRVTTPWSSGSTPERSADALGEFDVRYLTIGKMLKVVKAGLLTKTGAMPWSCSCRR